MTLQFDNIVGTWKYGCPLVVLGLVSWFVLNSDSTQSLRLGKNGTHYRLGRNSNSNNLSLNRRLLNVNQSQQNNVQRRSLLDLVKELKISARSSQRYPNLYKSSWRSQDLLHIQSEFSRSLPDLDREFDGKGMKKGISVGSASTC